MILSCATGLLVLELALRKILVPRPVVGYLYALTLRPYSAFSIISLGTILVALGCRLGLRLEPYSRTLGKLV